MAIKVLSAAVMAGDADRVPRFQREAEVLAALNHPNIAAIYGLEKGDGITRIPASCGSAHSISMGCVTSWAHVADRAAVYLSFTMVDQVSRKRP